jgi:hypothetical protein
VCCIPSGNGDWWAWTSATRTNYRCHQLCSPTTPEEQRIYHLLRPHLCPPRHRPRCSCGGASAASLAPFPPAAAAAEVPRLRCRALTWTSTSALRCGSPPGAKAGCSNFDPGPNPGPNQRHSRHRPPPLYRRRLFCATALLLTVLRLNPAATTTRLAPLLFRQLPLFTRWPLQPPSPPPQPTPVPLRTPLRCAAVGLAVVAPSSKRVASGAAPVAGAAGAPLASCSSCSDCAGRSRRRATTMRQRRRRRRFARMRRHPWI